MPPKTGNLTLAVGLLNVNLGRSTGFLNTFRLPFVVQIEQQPSQDVQITVEFIRLVWLSCQTDGLRPAG